MSIRKFSHFQIGESSGLAASSARRKNAKGSDIYATTPGQNCIGDLSCERIALCFKPFGGCGAGFFRDGKLRGRDPVIGFGAHLCGYISALFFVQLAQKIRVFLVNLAPRFAKRFFVLGDFGIRAFQAFVGSFTRAFSQPVTLRKNLFQRLQIQVFHADGEEQDEEKCGQTT